MIRGPDLEIVTQRFVLRSLDRTGAEPLRRWLASGRINDALEQVPREFSVAAAVAFIDRFDNRTSFLLGIWTREEARLLGFYTLHVDPRHLVLTVTLAIGEEDVLNQAVAAETARAVVDWAFDRAGLEKLVAQVAETNRLTADWLGTRMQLEGRLRDEIRGSDGTSRVTVLRFGLLKSDWAAVRERSIRRQAERGF
jgi:RimJ/RimL family protein N-acetyltransferase